MAREKNLEVLLEAFRAIEQRVPPAKLVLVGSGPLQEELQSACPGAVFAGQRRGEDLAAHYASADLFLFPSVTETFGNVTTEAMASGLPVVAFDYAAAAQVIADGEQGVRVPFGDGRAFVDAAVALAFDPERRERLGTCGARARPATRLGGDRASLRSGAGGGYPPAFGERRAAARRGPAAAGLIPIAVKDSGTYAGDWRVAALC